MRYLVATIRRLDVEQNALQSSPFELTIAGYQPVLGTLEIQWINGGFRTWLRCAIGTISLRDIPIDWNYTSATRCHATALYPALGDGTAAGCGPAVDIESALTPAL